MLGWAEDVVLCWDRGKWISVPGCLHPWGLGKANPGSWGAPSLQIQVCAGCPVGLGSGADSCFFLPSVYLYVFG